MARIAGIDLPANKRMEIGLTYIYGIGKSRSNEILKKAGIDKNIKVKDLTEENTTKLRQIVEKDYRVEGELRSAIAINIKRLVDINSYRGSRHQRRLPVRGQRTKTNARSRKGRRTSVSGKK